MAIFGSTRAATPFFTLEIDGLTVGVFNNVGPVRGITRNTAQATDENGQIHEVPMRFMNKRLSLGAPIEGTVTKDFYDAVKAGTEFSGTVVFRDANKNQVDSAAFQGGIIVDSGADTGDRETDGFQMATAELIIDEWL